MSLLLDALKKAEQVKRQSPPSAEPASENPAAAKPAIPGVAPGPTLGSAARRAEQEAARTLFTAKQPPMQNRPMWLLLGGLALLAIAAGGFWLWYTLTYPSSQPPMAIQSTAPVRPRVQLQVATPPPVVAEQPPIAEPAPPTKPAVTSGQSPASSPAIQREPRSQTTARPPSGPRMKRSGIETVTVSPELSAAYGALTRGDFATARQQYQVVLSNDPLNLDAYLGLATIAASTGDPITAQAHYRKALEIDPTNAVAAAGLATLQGSQNTAASESQLKAQIAGEPQVAAPYSALGHIYSAQARWGDAQQVFFEAYRREPANPDNAFNLAVSLDHLGQGQLAREYYAKALQLSTSHPASFNAADVTTRLNQLAP